MAIRQASPPYRAVITAFSSVSYSVLQVDMDAEYSLPATSIDPLLPPPQRHNDMAASNRTWVSDVLLRRRKVALMSADAPNVAHSCRLIHAPRNCQMCLWEKTSSCEAHARPLRGFVQPAAHFDQATVGVQWVYMTLRWPGQQLSFKLSHLVIDH